jgi:3'-phosphoadenosine 5'-phosphosulfate sulfotransferase (PAPS reductase)/FAD synthetase
MDSSMGILTSRRSCKVPVRIWRIERVAMRMTSKNFSGTVGRNYSHQAAHTVSTRLFALAIKKTLSSLERSVWNALFEGLRRNEGMARVVLASGNNFNSAPILQS